MCLSKHISLFFSFTIKRMSVLTNPSQDQLKKQSFNRRRYDGCTTTDDMRIQTGPGRYQLDAPPQYCNACFAPEPTIHQQKWGASLNSQFIKTDVESDLLNINRPTTRTVCDQYDPEKDKINKAGLTRPQECSFPQTHSRLVDPPCTLRSSGWNRWEWLCENPQEGAMMPFDHLITTRLQQKDQFRPCIPVPIDSTKILPTPNAYDDGLPYEGLETSVLSDIQSSVSQTTASFPRGVNTLPAAPSALYGIQPAPVNQPSVALGKYDVSRKL
jgi:hypothetical protein